MESKVKVARWWCKNCRVSEVVSEYVSLYLCVTAARNHLTPNMVVGDGSLIGTAGA